ncbi:MAG: SDR family NAD(P)-dependent oxidoreductase [Pyrinomonadaceae bacterium]|nr:SDR family NAD(P)-dependent oxidoreductase [Pyrinomonadaceae bacterium]
MSDQKVWFITGSSTGFGRELAEEVLAQGYKVVATARKPETLSALVKKYPQTARVARLDVTNKDEAHRAIEEAVEEFGRIDVLVNNAGYGLMGALEEPTDEQIRQQFETNIFGALNVMRAVLPQMRKQQSGHILNISSVGGFIAFPATGYYSASKFALEALSQALAGEAAHHGIRVTIVQPGAFRTDFNGRSLHLPETRMTEYPATDEFVSWLKEMDGKQPGDPRKAAQAMIKVVESENPPLRLPLGEDSVTAIEAELEAVKKDIAPWREVGIDTAYAGATFGAIGGK